MSTKQGSSGGRTGEQTVGRKGRDQQKETKALEVIEMHPLERPFTNVITIVVMITCSAIGSTDEPRARWVQSYDAGYTDGNGHQPVKQIV